MISCSTVERADINASGEAIPTESSGDIVDTITLDETDRHRRRILLNSDGGIEFLLELEAVTLLKQNDVLRLSDGRGIVVKAQAEPLYEIRANNRRHLLQLTWHVGNRHLASEIHEDHIRIRQDPVIKRMLEQLGATVSETLAGFNPQGGAYGDAHSSHHHSHDHSHVHGHGHGHDNDHAHSHDDGHTHELHDEQSNDHALADK